MSDRIRNTRCPNCKTEFHHTRLSEAHIDNEALTQMLREMPDFDIGKINEYLHKYQSKQAKELARLREGLDKVEASLQNKQMIWNVPNEKPSYLAFNEEFDLIEQALSPKSQCEHDKGDHWERKEIGGVDKRWQGVCPWCPAPSKPQELK